MRKQILQADRIVPQEKRKLKTGRVKQQREYYPLAQKLPPRDDSNITLRSKKIILIDPDEMIWVQETTEVASQTLNPNTQPTSLSAREQQRAKEQKALERFKIYQAPIKQRLVEVTNLFSITQDLQEQEKILKEMSSLIHQMTPEESNKRMREER